MGIFSSTISPTVKGPMGPPGGPGDPGLQGLTGKPVCFTINIKSSWLHFELLSMYCEPLSHCCAPSPLLFTYCTFYATLQWKE